MSLKDRIKGQVVAFDAAARPWALKSRTRAFAYEFQVGENREIEFICELRALQGEAWFDADKLQVVPAD